MKASVLTPSLYTRCRPAVDNFYLDANGILHKCRASSTSVALALTLALALALALHPSPSPSPNPNPALALALAPTLP